MPLHLKQPPLMFLPDSFSKGFIVIGISHDFAIFSKKFSQTVGLPACHFIRRNSFYSYIEPEDAANLEAALFQFARGEAEEAVVTIRFVKAGRFPIWTRFHLHRISFMGKDYAVG